MQTSTDQLCVCNCIQMHVICISWVFGISMVKFVWITCVLHNGDIGTRSMWCGDCFLFVCISLHLNQIFYAFNKQHKMKLDQANYSMETIKWLKTLQPRSVFTHFHDLLPQFSSEIFCLFTMGNFHFIKWACE